jgi:SpoVK/Ycf46/Vps4 family AAA+-type ATPase
LHISNRETRDAVKNLGIEHWQGKIDRWLQAPDISVNYYKALKQRHKGTGHWFLEKKVFTEWKMRPNTLVWLHGIPGCGKTILSATIIEHLERTILPSQSLLYFYFDFNDISKQSFDGMIRSLISQLYNRSDITRTLIDSLCGDGRQQPSSESLCKIFLQLVKQVDRAWIILDALDECKTRKGNQTEGLLSWIRGLLDSELKNVHLLVTSRLERDIQMALEVRMCKECIISIQSNLVTDDIRAYIYAKVRKEDGLQRWRGLPEVQNEIENQLVAKANGM